MRLHALLTVCSIPLVVGASLTSCTTIDPCGTFAFTGSENDGSTSNGITASVSFDFEPAECGAECDSDLIAWVQIVRTYSFADGIYLYPSSEKEDRATAEGWYLDRLAGKVWGYYGRNDDGSFASYVTTGSNSVDAVLGDSPSRPESDPWLDIWWQAVSVPMSIDPESDCQHCTAGYYFWSWTVAADGEVTGIIDAVGWEPLDDQFQDGVNEWNGQAPGLGKNTIPLLGFLGS